MTDELKKIVLSSLLMMIVFLPVRYSDCNSTATASPPSEEKCDWACKNLRADWNYLVHPDRINQCKPRELKEYGT